MKNIALAFVTSLTLALTSAAQAEIKKETPNAKAQVAATAAKAEKQRKPSSSYYWPDIVGLCMKYSGATHPPCNKANGADMILDHVAQQCVDNKECLSDAVKLCMNYSTASHPPCNAENGLALVLTELKRVAGDYR